MDSYITHLRQPRTTFVSISEYNQKFNTNVPENLALETELRSKIKKAKAQFGPNEIIPASVLQSLKSCKDDKKSGKMKKKTSLKEALNVIAETEAVAIELDDLEVQQAADVCNTCQSESCEGHNEESFEEEYEEASVEDLVNDHLSQSMSGKDLKRAQQHVIYFDRKDKDMDSKLMKGKDRYMKALQSFLKGDQDVEVRLYSNEKIKVKELNCNLDSLRSMLKQAPGKCRVCQCDC